MFSNKVNSICLFSYCDRAATATKAGLNFPANDQQQKIRLLMTTDLTLTVIQLVNILFVS